eukprot:UN15583
MSQAYSRAMTKIWASNGDMYAWFKATPYGGTVHHQLYYGIAFTPPFRWAATGCLTYLIQKFSTVVYISCRAVETFQINVTEVVA